MCEVLQSMKEQLVDIEGNMAEGETTQDMLEPAESMLLNMPVEILLKICSFLDAHFLKNTLSKVCSRFADILADDSLWKYWVHSKTNGCFPPLPDLKLWDEVDIVWEDVCVEMDVEKKKWSNVDNTMHHIVLKDVHFASVDTVLLVNKGELCISGGRDRGMALWNVGSIANNAASHECTATLHTARPKYMRDAHSGWVWDLASDNIDSAKTIYSASWDNTVKAWDIETDFTCKQIFKCGMSALSVVSADNLVMAGLYSKQILTFDERMGPSPINTYKAHKGSVLALNVYKHMVASVSEDKTLAVWDRVAGKLIVNDVKITEKAYPVCISWSPSAMYIGDSKGTLHLFHPEKHSRVKSHELWPEPPVTKPSSKVTGCCQGQGSMIVCSDQGEIKFLYNCDPPEEYCSVKTSTFDVTQLRYLNDIMVIGTCDSALEFWIPADRYPSPAL